MSFLFAVVVTFSVEAQNMPPEQRIEQRIERRLERLNQLIIRDRQHLSMTVYQQEELLKTINQAISTVRDEAPRPLPPVAEFEVAAIVENNLIFLRGSTHAQLFQQCSNASLPPGNVDEIILTANNQNVVSLFNRDSYWRDRAAICNVILQNVVFEYARPVGQILVYGSIEQLAFQFTGVNKAAILASCGEFLASSSPMNVDEMYVGIGNAPLERLYNRDGYWGNRAHQCLQIMKVVDSKIP